jgi:hypothetical protein
VQVDAVFEFFDEEHGRGRGGWWEVGRGWVEASRGFERAREREEERWCAWRRKLMRLWEF